MPCINNAPLLPSLGSWIITGGTNVGVMKLVGEAVRERLIADGSNTNLVAVGIASWGAVQGKKSLINNDVSSTVQKD